MYDRLLPYKATGEHTFVGFDSSSSNDVPKGIVVLLRINFANIRR